MCSSRSLADTESGQIEVVRNRGHHHRQGHGKPIDYIDVDRIDAVVCQGMGKRACASLTKRGVEVLITAAHTVRLGMFSDWALSCASDCR